MAPSNNDPSTTPAVLTASYTSPAMSKTFTHNIQAPLPPTTPANIDPETTKLKTAYLAELRTSTKKLQEEINEFLTQKMEEDKTAAAGGDAKEAKEEEMYGEEDVEEEV